MSVRYYLILPVFSLSVVALQTTFFEFVFFGRLCPQISLALVIFAGFYLDFWKGCFLTLILGFFLDCVASTIPGIFVFIYALIFAVSKLVSRKLYAEDSLFLMYFTFLCSLAEGIIITAVYRFYCEVDMMRELVNIFLPRSLALSILVPFLFFVFQRFKELVNGGKKEASDRL